MGRTGPLALFALVACTWLVTASARAEALVVVQLRNAAGAPAEGEVVLESGEGKPVASCTAAAGSCEMPNVPGGSYKVRVTPKAGKAPKPRSVMVPPTGRVSLIVNTEG